jgi:mevalonate kinase
MKRFYSLVALATTLGVAAAGYAQTSGTGDDKVLHAINRLTFGPAPGDIERVKAMGVKSFIEQQLNPSSIPESPAVLSVIANSTSSQRSTAELMKQVRELQQLKKEEKQTRTEAIAAAPNMQSADAAQADAAKKINDLGKF